MARLRTALLLMSILVTVRGQNIMDRSVIKDGESFMLTCNADVAGVQPAFKNIASIELSRKLQPSQADFTKLAQYLTSGPTEGREIQNTPDSAWTVSFTGAGDGTNNRAMAISVLVSPGKCNDAGVYKCNVVFYPIGGGTDTRFKEQNVTSEAGISNMVFSVDPDNSDLQNPTYSEYKEGENITITCRFNGPQDLRLQWQRGIKQGFSQFDDRVVSNYPNENDITATSNPLGSNTCGAYHHISTLKLSLQQVDDDTMYICAVQKKGQNVMTRNLTIGITEAGSVGGGGDSSGNPGPSTGGDSDPDVGMIVGIIIGILALIVIVIIIVVVIRHRRKKKEDKYDDDRPDANTESNLHAPPPVFYSKPSKPPPEEKDNTTTRDGERHEKARYDDYDNAKDSGAYDRRPYYDNDYNSRREPSGGRRSRNSRGSASSGQDNPRYSNNNRYPHDSTPYATVDVSRSEDESAYGSDIPLDRGKPKPKPKRRSHVPAKEEEKQLHYAELDLPRREDRNQSRPTAPRHHDREREREPPVEYAEISV